MVDATIDPSDPLTALFGDSAPAEPNPVAMIVDADSAVRRLCSHFLHAEGWNVIEAADGETALVLFEEHAPDLVILDLDLPMPDGLETTRRLRASAFGEELPIVLLSSEIEAEDMLTGLEAGADAYLAKPIKKRELLLRLQSLTRLRRAGRRTQEWQARLGEQTRSLSLLLDFSMALSRREDLESIIETTIDMTAQLTACQRISIMLPDPCSQSLAIVGSTGMSSQVVRNVRLGIGESIAGKVFRSGAPILINSHRDLDNLEDKHDVRLFEGLPMLSLPMYSAETIVGVINLTSRLGGRPFEQFELNFLNLLMNFAASSIQSVRNRQARDEARDSIVVALAKLAEHRDDDTGTHLDRVTQYCLCLASDLRSLPEYEDAIGPSFLGNIERAAPLHDIGKVAIPDAILLKPGRLTEEEMAVMRTHTRIGADTIRSLLERTPDSEFLKMAEEIAESHHEWFDGSGYPNGRSGRDIPLAARIVAIADVYDALTTRRIYKDAWPHEKAVEVILSESGTHFDPDVVDAFLRVAGEFESLAKELADPVDPEPLPVEQQHLRRYRSASRQNTTAIQESVTTNVSERT